MVDPSIKTAAADRHIQIIWTHSLTDLITSYFGLYRKKGIIIIKRMDGHVQSKHLV